MTKPPSNAAPPSPAGNAMWGGRFSAKPADLMQAINVSIGFDKRLASQDLAGSRAHAAMLAEQGIISAADAAAIQTGLNDIESEIAAGTFPFRDEFEDIHLNVETRLREIIGPAAGRLHTARSATTRWPWISAFGCARRATGPSARSKPCRKPFWPRQSPMPPR